MTGFLERLFSTKRVLAKPPRDVEALIGSLLATALHLVKSEERSRSHFGGVPNLPLGIAWPERKGRRLGFLARLSLADLQQAGVIEWLPVSGALLFFYDLLDQPWGYDPADRGGAVVLHVADLEAPLAIQDRDDQGMVVSISHRDIAFRNIRTSPPSDHDEVQALQLTDEELDALFELEAAVFQEHPRHQVAGYPSPVQGSDMDLECQLVTHGLYCGNSSGYEDARASALREGAKDWRLLFQFDSDDELGVMWGDAGMLYFWVQQHAASRGDFSNAWLVLQCS
jgi:uncharacterized protein YwqG